MDPTQLRLEALKLAVQFAERAQSYSPITVTHDAKTFEDYLLGPQPKQETPPADPEAFRTQRPSYDPETGKRYAHPFRSLAHVAGVGVDAPDNPYRGL